MISEEAKKRAKILTFWKEHGLKATVDAHGVHRRTLFAWQKRLKSDKGKLESLNSRSKAPKVDAEDSGVLSSSRRSNDSALSTRTLEKKSCIHCFLSTAPGADWPAPNQRRSAAYAKTSEVFGRYHSASPVLDE
jgi:transposase-like protein